MLIYLLNKLSQFLYKFRNEILTFTIRPGETDFYKESFFIPKIDYSKVAIVIQGPILKKQYLEDTLKIYRNHFPQSILILSTWKENFILDKKLIKKLKVKLILNEEPKISGISNVNFQIKSTIKGIRKAQSLNCKYIAKTRTDQRIYSNNWISFMLGLLKSFPLKINIQKNRIIVLSMNTYKYRYFSISDMFMFGEISDMIKFWDCQYDKRTSKNSLPHDKSLLSWSKNEYAEVYLMVNYLRKIRYKFKFTLKSYWSMCIDLFCIIDQQTIQMHWLKYNNNNEYRYRNLGQDHNDQEFRFSDWIGLSYIGYPKLSRAIQENHNKTGFKEKIILKTS